MEKAGRETATIALELQGHILEAHNVIIRNILGSRVILGLYWGNGKENGNYYNGLGLYGVLGVGLGRLGLRVKDVGFRVQDLGLRKGLGSRI